MLPRITPKPYSSGFDFRLLLDLFFLSINSVLSFDISLVRGINVFWQKKNYFWQRHNVIFHANPFFIRFRLSTFTDFIFYRLYSFRAIFWHIMFGWSNRRNLIGIMSKITCLPKSFFSAKKIDIPCPGSRRRNLFGIILGIMY
jgi:hypothetical protein